MRNPLEQLLVLILDLPDVLAHVLDLSIDEVVALAQVPLIEQTHLRHLQALHLHQQLRVISLDLVVPHILHVHFICVVE